MDDQNQNSSRTGFTKMIKDLRSEIKGYQQNSRNSFPQRQDSAHSTHSVLNVKTETGSVHETPKRQKLNSTSENGSGISNADSVPGSPWEWRRIKGENIALKTRLTHQESAIQQLHNVRREMEEVFRKEKKLLEIQIEENKQLIKQLELRVDIGRQTVQEAKSAQVKVEREFIQMKSKMEKKVLSLVDDNAKLTEELRHCIKQEVKTENNINIIRMEQDKSELEQKLEISSKRINELQEKLREALAFKTKVEIQNVEIQSLKVKCETFQSEKAMLEEGKHFMTRAAQVTELERELKYAHDLVNSMRESVKGKLLLEEQMATMEYRLQRTENLEKQISQLEVTQSELLAKIADYESIGISGGPTAVKREIHRLQQAEIVLTAEEGQLRSQMDAIQRQLNNSEKRHEETKKALSEITASHERASNYISRLQKKASLLTRERDSYRQQLDSYEKEITGYQSGENLILLNERIPALERAIENYRELVAKLEADIESMDGTDQREQLKKLKKDNEKLRAEFEHRALKGDFNINMRIMHYKFNPASLAEQQAEEKQKALVQEVEQLRSIVASGNPSSIPAVSSLQAQELAELHQKHEIKISRLKDAFKASSHEYRQACYQLFGWRVDRTKEGQYKLSSQYAESPDDYLFFIVNEDGVNMIETPFSATLTDFIERHLKGQHSVPMFLNAVQSDLFDHQTVTNVVIN